MEEIQVDMMTMDRIEKKPWHNRFVVGELCTVERSAPKLQLFEVSEKCFNE